MPKRHRHFRLSEEGNKALDTYCEKWTCTPTEAIEKLLIRWRYLDDLGFSQFKEILTEELACSLRVIYKGSPYCMHGVPNNVKLDRRLIETLDICRVCRRRKIGLTQASQILKATDVKVSSPGESFEMAGQEDLEQPKEDIGSATPSSFKSSISPPDPITKPAPVPSNGFSCPIFKNRAYCNANPCEHRKQCREVGRIPHG